MKMRDVLVAVLVVFFAICAYVRSGEKESKIEGDRHLAKAQLVLYEFFNAKEKNYLDAYAKLAVVEEAIRKDASLKDEAKQKLRDVIRVNRDLVTTYRKGLDTEWLEKIPRPKREPTPKENGNGSTSDSKTSEEKPKEKPKIDKTKYERVMENVERSTKKIRGVSTQHRLVRGKKGEYPSTYLLVKIRNMTNDPIARGGIELTMHGRWLKTKRGTGPQTCRWAIPEMEPKGQAEVKIPVRDDEFVKYDHFEIRVTKVEWLREK